MSHKTLFITSRSPRHQQKAMDAAPDELDIVMLRDPDRRTVLTEIADAVFLISERAGTVDQEMIQAGKKLRLIQRLGSLTHDIDLAAAREANVPVCAWPLPGPVAVAEQMLWLILALLRKSHEVEAVAQAAQEWGESKRTDENTFAVNWSGRKGLRTLSGRTVGILGFGEIGAELARRLAGFGCQLLYNKRTTLPTETEKQLNLTYASKSDLCAQCDVLCNLLPYFPQTDMLLDDDFFAQMKPGAILVSAGSGSVIDEAALARALAAGHLGGAALDTFEHEPLRPDNPLLPLARDPRHNVILTPHTAAIAEPSSRAEEYENIRRALAGDPLRHRQI